MSKPKCLVICTKYPYPPTYGLKIAEYQLLSVLSDICDIHVVVITDEQTGLEDFQNWAQSKGLKHTVFVKHKSVMYLRAMLACFTGDPFQVAFYSFKDVEKKILEIVENEGIQLVIPILIRTAKYAMRIRKAYQVPVLMAMIDSVSLNYKRLVENSYTSWLRKAFFALEMKRLEEFEKLMVSYFDRTYLVNPKEVSAYGQDGKVFALPNYVEDWLLKYDKTSSSYQNYVIFFGKMDYQPNIDAVLWFLRYVFPKVDKKIKFGIIGPNISRKVLREVKKFGERVKIFGFIEDPYVILRSACAVVAPMKTGAGIQNKIIEAMAVESLVVLSPLAAAPIGGENGVHFFVEESPEDFVRRIDQIFHNPDKFVNMRREARRFIKENFSRESRKKVLDSHLKSLLDSRLKNMY